MTPTMDVNSAVAVCGFGFLYGLQLVLNLREKQAMRTEHAVALKAVEDERRLYAAALMATDHQPVAANVLRSGIRAADAVARQPIIPEGL